MSNYYANAVADDIRECIEDDWTPQDVYDASRGGTDVATLAEYINDAFFADDSVTGNGSGTYTFNCAEAREIVLTHMDEVADAYRGFGDLDDFARHICEGEWESLDVTARCHALYGASWDVAEELIDGLCDALDELIERGEIETGEDC